MSTIRMTVAALAAVAVAAAGCTAQAPQADQSAGSAGSAGSARSADAAGSTIADEHGLAGLDARQMIERLDATPVAQRSTDLIASVQPDELVLNSGDRTQSVPMPNEEFYLAVAPYDSRTHECYFHSLTTCLGELRNEQVQVTVTDRATGATVVDDDVTTFDNGFVGIWLPRGLDGEITVEHDGRRATAPISTSNPDDLTCLTSLRLA